MTNFGRRCAGRDHGGGGIAVYSGWSDAIVAVNISLQSVTASDNTASAGDGVGPVSLVE